MKTILLHYLIPNIFIFPFLTLYIVFHQANKGKLTFIFHTSYIVEQQSKFKINNFISTKQKNLNSNQQIIN